MPSSLRRWSSRLVAGPAERRSQPRGSCSACLAAATQWAPAPSFSSAAPGRMFPSAPRGGAPNTAAPSGAAGATQHSRARALGARSTLSTWSLAYEHGTPRAAPSTSLRQIYRIARRRCNFGSCLVPVAQADRAEPQPRVYRTLRLAAKAEEHVPPALALLFSTSRVGSERARLPHMSDCPSKLARIVSSQTWALQLFSWA